MTRRTPAQYDFDRLEFDEQILNKHFTPMKSFEKRYTVAHHMTIPGTGTGSALDACFATWQKRQASAQYGVDSFKIGQFVWDKDYAWATGSTAGNSYGISIEHANSTLAPKWEIGKDTWMTGAKLTAYIHKAYKFGRPVKDKTMKRHSDFMATACPGPFFKTIWDQYVAEAQKVYDAIIKGQPAPKPDPVPAPKPDPTPLPKPEKYTVKAGDTLVSIAREHGISLAQLLDLNNFSAIKTGDALTVGSTAVVEPAPKPTPKPTPAPTPIPAKTAFWIASWNILGENHKTWKGTRSKGVCAAAKSLGVSILATQECNTVNQSRDLRAAFKGWKHVPSVANNNVLYDASKYRETRPAKEYFLSTYQARKALVMHMVRIATGAEFTLINTHLPSDNQAERERAAKVLVKLIADVDGPIILTGDFNNASFYPGGPHDRFQRAGFKTMRQQSTVLNTNYAEFNADFGVDPGTNWLADILTRPKEITITDGQLIITKPNLSDHSPLVTRVEI